MKIGIDFDNTIACYDKVFINLAIKLKLISKFSDIDNKTDLKEFILSNKRNINVPTLFIRLSILS